MDQDLFARVDDHLVALLSPNDEPLEAALAANEAAGLAGINVAPNQGKLLNLLASIAGARRILEVGTHGGYSTIWLARALPEHGRLVTLELDPATAEVAEGNLARAGVRDRVEVRVGPAAASLEALAAEDAAPFDLVFLDADKGGYPDYLAWALRLARPGTVIVGDNVVRAGRVIDEDTDDGAAAGVRRFLELVAAEPRLTATAIQTVGSKGHDGFALAVVLPE